MRVRSWTFTAGRLSRSEDGGKRLESRWSGSEMRIRSVSTFL
jgi:hypothetical protein